MVFILTTLGFFALAAVDDRAEGRTFGVLGEPIVNVLLLDQALDIQFGAPTSAHPGR